MTALLRKDLYITGRQLRLLFIVALGLAFTPQFHAVGTIYLLALSMTLSQGSIASDSRSRWDQFAAMLPIPAWKIVLSKYLITFLAALSMGCVACAVRGFQQAVRGLLQRRGSRRGRLFCGV